MTDMRKVEEGLPALYRKLCGSEASVGGFEDITVGWETQIVAFTLTQPVEALDLVARIYSGSSGGMKAEREFNIMHRLASAGYPVPRVYSYEAGSETLGSPFIVMERIRGSTLWDIFFSSPKGKWGEVLAVNARLMAQLHRIPPAKVLPGFDSVRTRRRILARIDEESEELDRYGLDGAFSPLTDWLRENVRGITESPSCIIHRDFHPRNILLRQNGSPVVIDWATCTVGDYREDLCWTGLLAGTFIDEALKRAVYDSYAKASEREIFDLPYFEAYSCLRRLADVAVTAKAGASARGMRPEAVREIGDNKPHFERVVKEATRITGEELSELSRLISL